MFNLFFQNCRTMHKMLIIKLSSVVTKLLLFIIKINYFWFNTYIFYEIQKLHLRQDLLLLLQDHPSLLSFSYLFFLFSLFYLSYPFSSFSLHLLLPLPTLLALHLFSLFYPFFLSYLFYHLYPSFFYLFYHLR